MARQTIIICVLALLGACTAAPSRTDGATYGGASGADLSIAAIEPGDEPLTVGQAGDDPADISRYLLARGAQNAKISPSGENVAFLSSVSGIPQIWISPSANRQPLQLTFGNGVDFFEWTPDSAGLLYGADNNGNEQESYFFISADGKEENLILPAVAGGFRVFGGFGEDSDVFYFASTERNQLDFDIYEATMSGETRMLHEGTYGNFVRSVSPDGQFLIVAEVVGEDSDNLYLLNTSSRLLKTIAAPDVRANHADAGFAWEADSSAVWFATNEGREFASLARYDLSTGQVDVDNEPDSDIADVHLCGGDRQFLIWTTNENGFHRLHARNRDTGAELAPPELPDGVYTPTCATDSAEIAIHINGWKTPGNVLVWNPETGATSQIFRSSLAGLDPARLIEPVSIAIPARDGVQLQGLLYLPDESSRVSEGPPPVVFLVHGGPTSQSAAIFNAVAQYHVDRGVAVFLPNVRGSTGFGRTYATLDDREKRLDSVRDLVDMLAWLKADGRVDADRAAVVGGSYGGYMVNAVLAAYPDAFDAGVSLYGVADWTTALEIASPALKASDRIEYGDITEQRWKDFYADISPIAQADRIKVPVLYSHGVTDPRIDISETETMVKTLRRNGVEAQFIRIPDEGHGWRKLSNQLFYYRKQAEFIEEKLSAAGQQ